MKLELADCDLAGAIRDVAHLLAPQMEAAGYKLALDLAKGASAATPRACGRSCWLCRTTRGAMRSPAWIRIRTPVLGAQYLLQLFLAFHRGEHARSGAVGGSGLGLAVVRAIAEAHGGVASYRRGDAGGAVFEIAWPMPMPGLALN